MPSERAKFFKDHGWLKIDDVFTCEELEPVRGELMKMAEQGTATKNYDLVSESHKKKYNGREFTTEVCEPSRFNAICRQFVTSGKIGALMREVMDIPRIRFFRDMALFKAPDSDTGTKLHQDAVYFPIDRGGIASVWIALTDLPANSGTMRFIDGSHKWSPLGRVQVPIEEWLADKHPEHADLLTSPPALNVGGVTIHDGHTLHGSDASTWDQIRMGYALSYFPADALFNAMPSRYTDGLVGLKQDEPFDHEMFPIVA